MLYLVNVLNHSGGGTSFDGPWYTQTYNSITDGFNALVDGVVVVVDFVQSLVYDLGLVLYYTGYFLARIPSYLGFLPTIVISSLLLGFGIAVAYLIIGRK